ncbi:MAG TPA: DUF3836 domain-containing protein [Bacteroidaceae bacterium]|nr:DUF3836 domain-containing protein [Bacteroidaceae bacterium]
MKAIIFKSALVTIMLFFTCIGASLAQDKNFYHNVIEAEGTKIINVYVMDDFNSLRNYKKSVIDFDEYNRPLKKVVRMWSRNRDKWEPCRTFTYKYTDEFCYITMKWQWNYTFMKDQKYAFPLAPSGLALPVEQLAMFDIDQDQF